MSFKAFKAGVLRTASKLSVWTGGALKEVERVRVVHDGALREIYLKAGTPTPPPSPPLPPPPPPPPPPVVLTVTISPTQVPGVIAPDMGGPENEATASASGGTGPYSYFWELASWSQAGETPVALSPTNATSVFSKGSIGYKYGTAYFKCTATDSLGNTGSAQVFVEFFNF